MDKAPIFFAMFACAASFLVGMWKGYDNENQFRRALITMLFGISIMIGQIAIK